MATTAVRIARALARIVFGVLRIVVILTLVLLVAAAFGYRWLDRNILSTLPTDLSEFRGYLPPTSCRVYAADGTQVDEFYLERRIWIPLDELPPSVTHAFVAAEDRRFFTHKGVDLLGIGRAFLLNLEQGSISQGGSTITQQLVKNLIVGSERSYTRKIKEAVLAWRLERELTKRELLELYVNFIYLGGGNYGVEAAARDYFGISARSLDPGQAALLAGLVPAPSRFSPRSHPERAAVRRAIVLRLMVDEGYLSADEAAQLLDDPVSVPRESRVRGAVGTAYVSQVRREVRKAIGGRLPFEAGMQVHTPLDLSLQALAESSVREAVEAVEKRQGRRGIVQNLPRAKWADFLARAPGLDRNGSSGGAVRPSNADCFQALVGEGARLDALLAGPWSFSLVAEDRAARVRGLGEGALAGPLEKRIRPGDVLRVCRHSDEEVRLDPRPTVEGAAVVLENATGRVVALVGGYEVGLEGFIRATQARRQPGSSFKPYVFAAAMLEGRTQVDTVVDAPLALPAGGGKVWSPQNYTGKFAGPVTLREALAKSYNTTAVRLGMEVGMPRVIRIAREMGVATPLREDLTVALGSSEVTLMDQVLGYATIARMGLPTPPVYIDRLEDARDVVVGRAGGPVMHGADIVGQLPGGDGPRALPAGVAYELADMMRETIRSGTARSAHRPGLDRAGKTGTTNGYVDAWFIGFTPRYTVGVWIGTDGTSSLGEKESGGRAALPAWVQIADALPHEPGERMPVPDDALLLEVDRQWLGFGRGRAPPSILPREPVPAGPLEAFTR